MRNDIQSTYVQIMQELEQERERRWKAEQAAKRLATCIQEMHSKKERDMKETAVEAITKLKQALSTEREAKLRLLDDTEKLKEQLQKALHDLSLAKETEEVQKKSLRLMEEMAAKNEREKLEQQTHQHKKVQNAQMHAAALGREVELMRNNVETQKGQIQQLQALLVNREQEHREDLQKRYTLDSKELQEVIHTEVKRIEKEHNQELKVQQAKVDELSKRYSELEDEFRMALQIEANRFKELQVAFETISEDNASNKQALLVAHQKDEQSSAMLSELSALVKEQKGRIAELSKAKLEQSIEHRDRIQTLEAHVEEARKRMVQLELLKKENSKLAAEVQAQESVIAGLRAERKLWGQELAKQGSSLSQDRGRLEAQIETAKSELVMVRKQLEKETDALKIKTKILEDQTETIRKLKEGLVERDEEIKKTRQESLKIQQSLEDQLAEERGANQESQENLERLRERKQELKQQVTELEKELEESRKAHTILNNKWKEKSNLIGQLELQVREMKDNWEAKDKKLTSERDKALAAANIAIERLRTADDAFRNQLDQKVQAFQEEIARLEQEKNMEIEQANQRVLTVEEEMRELLQENQASKRAMEEKIKRLTHVLGDLQSDLF
ncbi:hypothetical protein CHS0354_042814 [Potamilus streckersoni]|uniref:Uncharacterized protein n=1 Tax=Potamilus streckersoni TaxID=2493646 RepID=A0AAE0W800_9BIVA|nr:hypothetical protein CHS0354_042814 [Potamilus streckersoni]